MLRLFKSESRNPKYETNNTLKKSNAPNKHFCKRLFFESISSFDIRISDFKIRQLTTVNGKG